MILMDRATLSLFLKSVTSFIQKVKSKFESGKMRLTAQSSYNIKKNWNPFGGYSRSLSLPDSGDREKRYQADRR